ncbi:MAG: M20/M25/M40 family metallo-hydrolase, partial [Planctomycetota bacterium]
MNRRALLPSLALVLVAVAAGVVRAGDTQPAISADEIRKTVDKLAGEDFLGREAGSEGGRAAAEWLAAECEKVGLKPAGDDGTFFQNFKASGRPLRNVVATLPALEGSELADEVVVIGSHYDHLGKGGHGALDFMSGGGKVHYGADDNASGSTGTLTLARALAAAGPAKRRIVFVWFDGEELGLFGSKHYVKKPPFPLKKTAAMLNMDMIGRLRKDKLTVYGVNTGDTFPAIEKRAVEGLELKCEIKDTMPPNSDHFSFYEKKVPVIALFTGLHKDYHRATDTIEKVEVEGMVRILRYAYRLVRGLADEEGRAIFAQAKDGNAEAMFEQVLAMLDEDQIKKIFGDEESLQKMFKENGLGKVMEKLRGTGLFGGGGGGGRRPRFGVSTQESEDGKGVTVVRVTENSVASKSGVKEGDRILSFDGKEVHDVAGLTESIRAAKGKVTLVIERDGAT